jgi:hypothetical protein
MTRYGPRLLLVASLAAIMTFGLVPATTRGQDTTPASGEAVTGATVVAHGLINPRGFTFGSDGTLYVSLAGNGGLATDPTPAPAASVSAGATPDLVADTADVLTADESGAVVKIVDGCPVEFASGLPSYNFLPLNWADGVIDVAFLDGTLYALVDGGGEDGHHPDRPYGVYRIADDGSSTMIADLSAWFRANPVKEPTHDISPDAQPYAMIPGDGVLWISESNHEQLLTVTPDGTITRVVDLSPAAVLSVGVPTGLAMAPDGGVYLGLLSEFPLTDGVAKIVKIAPDGTVSDVWTGLTAVTDIALAPDGTLYATELSTGNTETDPPYHPQTGKVVRQTGPAAAEEVATGLDYPTHLAFDAGGLLYVAGPALGSNGGEGWIIQIDPAAAAVAVDALQLNTSVC